MPVSKRIMAPGSWSIRLRDDTPQRITDQIAMASQSFAHLIIIPGHIRTQGLTAANAVSLSIYTGVMIEQNDRLTLGGHHASMLLGDPDGKGQLPEVDTTATQSFSAWMTALKPSSVLSTGSYNAAATTLAWTWKIGQSRLDAIQYICDTMGYEWRVSDDLKLYGDIDTTLYPAATFPNPIITPWAEGRDLNHVINSIRAKFTMRVTGEDFTSKVLLKDDAGAVSTATIGSNPFQDQLGADYSWKRWIDGSSTVTSGTGSGAASAQLARFDGIDYYVTATTDDPCLMAKAECGQNAFCYDPSLGLYDVTIPNYYRGSLEYPKFLRMIAVSMNVTRNMGVLIRLNGSSPGLVDLTDWIVPEEPGGTIEIGAQHKSLSDVVKTRGLRGRAMGGYTV